MIRAILLLLLLTACSSGPAPEAFAPRATLLAENVVLNIRVDFRNDPQIADTIADETARLIGPEFRMQRMSGRELILNMTGRVNRGTVDDQQTIIMDWDVRDQGGTSIALFRVAIVQGGTLTGGISERDARGLAFYSAEKLTQQDALRDIIIARRRPQGQ